jgi:hypothetical protein
MGDAKHEWTKPAAVFVSLCALLATGTSAFAACQSLRTAEATLAVARQNLEESRAIITLDERATLRGDCSRDDSMIVELTARNPGRLATDLTYALVDFGDLPNPAVLVPGDPGFETIPPPPAPPLQWAWIGDVEVPPQGAAVIPISVPCSDLGAASLPTEALALAYKLRDESARRGYGYAEAENADRVMQTIESFIPG